MDNRAYLPANRLTSRMQFSTKASEQLVHTVLTWKLDEITRGESMYETSILQIPQELSELETYRNTFDVHILEEMRSDYKRERGAWRPCPDAVYLLYC
jgi:hypothetical protein